MYYIVALCKDGISLVSGCWVDVFRAYTIAGYNSLEEMREYLKNSHCTKESPVRWIADDSNRFDIPYWVRHKMGNNIIRN